MVLKSTHINNLAGVLATLSHGVLTPSTFSKLLCEVVSAVAAGNADPAHEAKSDKAVAIECMKSLAHTLQTPERELIEFMISTSGPLIDKLLETNAARLEKFERTEAGDAKKPAHLPASAGGRRYGTIKQKEDSRDYSFVASFRNSIPQKVDLRSTGFLGPVLNQGSAGTCSAHAAAAALRYLLRKEHVQDFPPSRLFVYYTTRVNIEGISPEIDSGCVLRDVCRALQKFHTCNERYMAYSDTQITERPPALAVANARLHTTFAYRAVEQTLSALRGALATGYPVIVGIQVYQTFESEEVANTGVVPMPSHNEECLGGHAVLLVAYDDETRTFTLQNSWGEWGQDGFFSLPYDYLIDTGLAGDFWCLTRFA